MKIFIIGPEGSGKTVLLAMLSRYVAMERKDLVLEPVDRTASQYVVSALADLEKGDWPPSTRQAELRMLQWRFGSRGAPLHEIVMFDAAGQDLRQILLQNDRAILTDDQRATRTQIDTADFLVYLFDLNGFLETNDLRIRDENAWLFKTFLTRPEWQGKRRVVVLSKADIHVDMLAPLPNQVNEDAKVRELVKRHLPKTYTLDHLVDAEIAVNYFAVASVATKTVIDLEDKPVRVPKNPLEPVGIDKLVNAFVREAERIRRKTAGIVLGRRVWIACIVFAIMSICGIAVWGLCHSVPCKLCAGSGNVSKPSQKQTPCPKCEGKGSIPGSVFGSWWTDPCSNCKGTRYITVETTRAVTCGACKGSGKMLWWKQ